LQKAHQKIGDFYVTFPEISCDLPQHGVLPMPHFTQNPRICHADESVQLMKEKPLSGKVALFKVSQEVLGVP
jgi:hypothetical protein